MDRIAELEVFVAVVECGTLTAAARRTGRSTPSVTRIIAGLEHRVGARLLERTSRRCSPTIAGIRLVADARRLLESYDEACRTAAQELAEAKGRIKVTAPVVFGKKFLAPAIAEFLLEYPAISVDLSLTDRAADLHEEGYDLALRIGAISDLSLVAKRVGTARQLAVASPGYLKKHGTPGTPADLKRHALIHHVRSEHIPAWHFGSGRSNSIPLEPRLLVNHAEAALAAANRGLGITTALSYAAAAELEEGSLVRLLEKFEPEPSPVWLVWPRRSGELRRSRLMIEHLSNWFKRQRADSAA